MIDFSTEIADERMELNVSKNVDECLVISENETKKEFLNVNENKAKCPDGLTGKIKKKKHMHHNCIIFILIYSI